MLDQYPHLAPIVAGRHYLIATDGASKGNPGPGGWGLVKQLKDGDMLLKQLADAGNSLAALDEMTTTNNRMELVAAIMAVTGVLEPNTPAIIMADSEYVLNGITKYLPGWKAKGWKTADKKPVKNQELWERLEAACEGKTIQWVKVKGHSGHGLNEIADTLADGAARGGYARGRSSVKTKHPSWFVG